MTTIPAARSAPLYFVLLGVVPALLGADASPPGPPKSHVLFMGADLSVQQGKKFYSVEDVDGSEFVIQIKGEKKFVRTRLATNNVKVDHALKLTPMSVQLDELQGGPGYTPAADPRHKFNARSGAQGGAQAAHDWSATRLAEATDAFRMAQDPQMKKNYEDIMVAEQRNVDMTAQQLGSDMMSIPNMANGLALELAKGDYDMVDVSFKISSPEPLDDPYMVVLVEFHLRDAKPGETATLIHAKALDPIGPKPKYVRMREGGMPVGFKFDRFEVHIYNRGKEVATNASSRRVELTRDDARQYLLLEHMGEHKGETLPALAVPGSLPVDLRTRLGPERLQRVVYVRVSKDGVPLGAYVDEGCSLPLNDAELTAALTEAFFKPALAQGKPMDGVARVRLAELTL